MAFANVSSDWDESFRVAMRHGILYHIGHAGPREYIKSYVICGTETRYMNIFVNLINKEFPEHIDLLNKLLVLV